MPAAAWWWIVGGVNGAGKTTLAKNSRALRAAWGADAERVVWLNPDERAQELLRDDPTLEYDVAVARAVLEIEALVDRCIDERKPCIVETALSSDKYKSRVDRAHERGLKVGLIYVALSSVDLAILRVRDRVAAGGHPVPEDKIRARWDRSLKNLEWFARRVDRLLVFSNDEPAVDPPGGGPRLVAVKHGRTGRIRVLDRSALRDITSRLKRR